MTDNEYVDSYINQCKEQILEELHSKSANFNSKILTSISENYFHFNETERRYLVSLLMHGARHDRYFSLMYIPKVPQLLQAMILMNFTTEVMDFYRWDYELRLQLEKELMGFNRSDFLGMNGWYDEWQIFLDCAQNSVYEKYHDYLI